MLRERVVTGAIIGVALAAMLLYLPAAVVIAAFVLVILAAAWEWALFAQFTAYMSRALYVLAVAACLGLGWYCSRSNAEYLQSVLWLALAWWIVAFAWILFAPTGHNRFTAAVCGLLVMVPAAIALADLYRQPESGPQLVLFLLLLVWAADVGAYFVGRNFGRLKLAPRVSPQKTWEGLIGGVLVSATVAAAGAWWFARPPLAFLSLCLGVVLVSIVGDLTESMFKRYAGLKDSGSIFPGHGGVLDRFDSVTAAAPVFLLGLRWLERVS